MKLFNAQQLKEWDAYSIEQNFNDASELMELAANVCAEHLEKSEFITGIAFFCGLGNNGGDGLCMARILRKKGHHVVVYIAGDPLKGSKEFTLNLNRLMAEDIEVLFLDENNKRDFQIPNHYTVLDCLFGIGLTRPLEGWLAALVESINALPNKRISIDVPSGMMPDLLAPQTGVIIKAHITYTLQIPKRAFMFPENAQYVGDFSVLELCLDEDFENLHDCDYLYYTLASAVYEFRPRDKFTHKNQLGHALIMAGSLGKMGAAVLSARACLRAGAGLVTAHVPRCGYQILQTAVPEAMCQPDPGEENITATGEVGPYKVIACGPGMGTAPETSLMLRKLLLDGTHPLVLDADALNIIGQKTLQHFIKPGTVLTPHIGEFDKLFGSHRDNFHRLETMKLVSSDKHYEIILKGAHTCVTTSDNHISFNSSGNQGMATAGSGDVLTGIITALLAQGYSSVKAARLGVFIHGLAGDHARKAKGIEGMIAGDIVEALPLAIHQVDSLKQSFHQ
jgi:ADP-dependent NAD(P)H-hydrate dehydratase / NAD(P)H-hydrate epimerase